MKAPIDITNHIANLNKSKQLLQEKKNEELQKPITKRDTRLLTFIDREQKLYDFALAQFEWLLS